MLRFSGGHPFVAGKPKTGPDPAKPPRLERKLGALEREVQRLIVAYQAEFLSPEGEYHADHPPRAN